MNNINVKQSQKQCGCCHPITLNEKAELKYINVFNIKQASTAERKISQQPKKENPIYMFC